MPNLSAHIQTFSVLDAPYAGNDMQFESMDGYNQSLGGGGTIAFVAGAWSLTVGPAINDSIEVMKEDSFPLYPYTWAKRRQLKFRLTSQVTDDPLGEFCIMTGNYSGPFTGFGLVFTDTKIIGRVGDGSNTTDLDLFTGLTPGDTHEHLYEIVFYPGNGVYFYVDDFLIGSITTNLPSGTSSAGRLLHFYLLLLTDNQGAELRYSRIQFSQDR